MKYLVLIYGNPESRAIWESFSDEQRADGFAYDGRITEELAASGELIVTHALTDASETKRVTVRDGQTVATDGPFAEAKEQLAGFYLVECESIDRAIEIAGRAARRRSSAWSKCGRCSTSAEWRCERRRGAAARAGAPGARRARAALRRLRRLRGRGPGGAAGGRAPVAARRRPGRTRRAG